ncbi:F-box/LRR-repeat protein At4g14103-like [Chenopodium quinoa]|uniref:F-box/LRR-repeat protein At4g14103-like n=1 Tax=Chenopodium quinoa TaxID=63459 RepID=UPI000B799D7C|nr:F-box/LRR-repeat protein At4g14103-like [Chenopodium quinoa]XP_021749668.1 F-box/LRR-repeat protein At4g14103-like [Chenopodium quinoa]
MDLRLKPCSTTTLQNDRNCGDILISDRLTNLPDELLIRILSLLPTKDAAVTSILSKRMRCIFPLITSLEFDDSPISHCSDFPFAIQRFPTFVTFVDSVLSAYKSQYLTRFKLGVGADFTDTSCTDCKFNGPEEKDCCPDLKATQVNAWISFPLTRCGLRELDLRIQVKQPGDCLLPLEIFNCETLEVLKLDVNLSLDKTSTMSSFHLPNLKLLQLRVAFIFEEAFVTRLVSGCPVLEDLIVDVYWNHVHFTNISSPSLRRLCLFVNKLDYVDNTDCVIINTPNLEYLEYTDNLALQYSVPNMNCLVKADVYLENQLLREEFEVSSVQMLTFIRPLSNVQHLTLSGACIEVLSYVDVNDHLPVFNNLKRLELYHCCNSWDKLLLAFLNCSPVLETLVFPTGFVSSGDTTSSRYNQDTCVLERRFCEEALSVVPSCCRNHLKRIVIKYYYGIERELCLIRFLLRYALVLEDLVLFRRKFAKADRMFLENTLQNLPRASVACSIHVLNCNLPMVRRTS